MRKMPSTKTLLGLALGVCFGGAVCIYLLGNGPSVRGLVQLCIFPLLLFFLSLLTFRGVHLPRFIVGISIVGVLSGALVRYGDVGLERGAMAIVQFNDDPLGNQTRIFRDEARAFVGKGSVTSLGIVQGKVHSDVDARNLLKERENLGGVVWGSDRGITMSMRPAAPISLASLPAGSVARRHLEEWNISDLQVVSQVPLIGVSNASEFGTFEFVGRMAYSLHRFPAILAGGTEPPEFEHQLMRAASISARWRSMGHRAAPKWMLGTLYLMRALSGPEIGWGDLRCAEASLRSARLTVKSGSNPALLAAILNNQAILYLYKSEYVADQERTAKVARQTLTMAGRFRERFKAKEIEPSYWEPIKVNVASLGIPVVVERANHRRVRSRR